MTWERLAKALDRCDSADAVARVVSFAACELLGADRGAMFVRDEDRDLKLLTATGFAYEPLADYLVIPLDSDLPAARAARDSRFITFEDNRAYAAAYPDLAAQRRLEGMEAEVVVPLPVRSAAFGVAVFDWYETRSFVEPAHAKLVRLGDLCGAAVQRVASSIPSLPGASKEDPQE